MNTIIGQAARDEYFFPRPDITKEIWEKLDKGNNLLMVAPRRVGKSSILFNLLDDPKSNYNVIYYTSESVNNINEFYKKLFDHIVNSLKPAKKINRKTLSFAKDLLSRIDEIGISELSVKLGKHKMSYLDELITLMEKLELKEEKLLILVDEFAQTVENIYNDSNEKFAIQFLQTKREIRQNPKLSNKVQFIYAGSIGLENVVSRFSGTKFINDVTPINVPPLNRKEAELLIDKILNGTDIIFSIGARNHLLKVIKWWIPFYFHLILDECDRILKKKDVNEITSALIDQAIDSGLKQKVYFKHWFDRLQIAYKGASFSFIKNILNDVVEKGSLSSAEISNLAFKYEIEDSYTNLIHALKHDGYINNDDDASVYKFNSPLLERWWYKNVTN